MDNWSRPEHLDGVPLISDSYRLWKRWFDVYGKSGMKVSGPSFFQTTHAIDAAEQGLGIALVPRLLAEAGIREGRLVQVLGKRYELETDFAFYVVTSEHAAPSDAVGAMEDWLLLEASKQ
jgi:LysR family glycine cleavage system transcriptional activator